MQEPVGASSGTLKWARGPGLTPGPTGESWVATRPWGAGTGRPGKKHRSRQPLRGPGRRVLPPLSTLSTPELNSSSRASQSSQFAQSMADSAAAAPLRPDSSKAAVPCPRTLCPPPPSRAVQSKCGPVTHGSSWTLELSEHVCSAPHRSSRFTHVADLGEWGSQSLVQPVALLYKRRS